MSAHDDGGPAFPVPDQQHSGGLDGYYGMSLRDYFAAHAPPPPAWWMKDYATGAPDLDTVADVIAQWTFVYADEMLKARRK